MIPFTTLLYKVLVPVEALLVVRKLMMGFYLDLLLRSNRFGIVGDHSCQSLGHLDDLEMRVDAYYAV